MLFVSEDKSKYGCIYSTGIDSEFELIDATCTRNALAMEDMVDTISRILYEVDLDQSDFELP
jgi:hypothetical protein